MQTSEGLVFKWLVIRSPPYKKSKIAFCLSLPNKAEDCQALLSQFYRQAELLMDKVQFKNKDRRILTLINLTLDA